LVASRVDGISTMASARSNHDLDARHHFFMLDVAVPVQA
jgi:hypothetical protein